MGNFWTKYSRLRLTKVERGGFFILFILLLFSMFLKTPPHASRLGGVVLQSKEINLWLLAYDSAAHARALRRDKIFPFNPNFIAPAKADRLGLSAAEFKKLKEYRETGKWINSALEFKHVTGVSNEWMEQFSSLFKFPEFLNNATTSVRGLSNKIPFGQATFEELTAIRGVGPGIARRIISARDKWNGIGHEQELMVIYGITPAIKQALLDAFVYDQKTINARNVNKLNPSDLTEIPGIHYSLAKSIWEFVRLRHGLNTIDQLNLLEEIHPRLFKVIELYLYAMKNKTDGT